jgi:hypothetical protein
MASSAELRSSRFDFAYNCSGVAFGLGALVNVADGVVIEIIAAIRFDARALSPRKTEHVDSWETTLSAWLAGSQSRASALAATA